MLQLLAIVFLDAFVLMCAVGWLSDRERPEIYKSAFAAISISFLGVFGLAYVLTIVPGVFGAILAFATLGFIAGAVVWICFDMAPQRAFGAGGIFLAYKMLTALPFIILAAST